MNNKLLIGIIAAIVILLVVAEILAGTGILFVNHFMIWIPLAVWIFFVRMVWKKRTGLFHVQMELKLAERRLKWLRIFLLLGGISWALVWIILLYWIAITDESEMESILVYIPFSLAVLSSVIGTIGFLVILLKGRRKLHKETLFNLLIPPRNLLWGIVLILT